MPSKKSVTSKKVIGSSSRSKEKDKEKKEKAISKSPKTLPIPQLLRGMRDILPVEMPYWLWLRNKLESLATYFGYHFIETPILEMRDLFIRSVGKQTDIVEKEMYTFQDIGGENICLRPEGTASIARAYINHGMLNLPQPVKLFYFGPMFRHERPQAGRYRQFYQAGFEILGDSHPVLDAELILIAFSLFHQELGLPVIFQINSIGCQNCRAVYRNELINYYKTKRGLLCENCKRRLMTNPFRLLDCKEPQCEILKENAPQTLDYLCEECRNHFFKVIEYLDDLGLPFNLNPHLVRGLDYYNRTVFEIYLAEKSSEKENPKESEKQSSLYNQTKTKKEEEEEETLSAQAALGGGGRYDGLIELLGGRPTPAVGFALGIERVIAQLKEAKISPSTISSPQVFIAQLGESARRKALHLLLLLQGQVRVAFSFSKDGLKPQLELANRLGVSYTIIIGQKEVMDETVILRDMEAGIQEIIPYNKIVADLKRRLGLT
jgi:histidyl-tRNA synthetase